jgi:hypothetical protein
MHYDRDSLDGLVSPNRLLQALGLLNVLAIHQIAYASQAIAKLQFHVTFSVPQDLRVSDRREVERPYFAPA